VAVNEEVRSPFTGVHASAVERETDGNRTLPARHGVRPALFVATEVTLHTPRVCESGYHGDGAVAVSLCQGLRRRQVAGGGM